MHKKSIFGMVALGILLHLPLSLYAINYTITVSSQGPGGVGINPTNSNSSYPQGVTVTVTATPNASYFFTGWSGDTNGTQNPLNITVNSSMVITGNFSATAPDNVTLTTNGQGSIALNPPGGGYTNNSTVTATATPAAGWLFTSWSGDTNSTVNPLTFTLTGNLSLTGNFVQLPAFDIEPQTTSNATGATVTFTSHSVGTAPVTYQWYYNGIALSGATNANLSLTNIQPVNAGNYWNTATNSYGSAISTTAALVLTNLGGSTNAVNICTEANLRSAAAAGGWVSIHCNGSFNLSGPLDITGPVILDATGFDVTINGSNAVRLIYVSSGVSFTATNVIFANGTVTNFSRASAYSDGGAIYNNGGQVTLISCLLTNNQASYAYDSYSTVGARGGAIFNNGGTIYLNGCSLSNNAAFLGGDTASGGEGIGGAIYTTNGTVTILHSVLSSNQCISGTGPGSFGGAIYQASGTLNINNVLFEQNISAGAKDSNNSLLGNAAAAFGGALAVNAGSATVAQCQFLENEVQGGEFESYEDPGTGGAIYNGGNMTIDTSTFAGNEAYSGYSSDHQTANTQGGAIFNSNILVLNHSCIFSNQVQGSEGGYIGQSSTFVPGGYGQGGGIVNAANLYVTNCTIALNYAIAGGGGLVPGFPPIYTSNGNAFGGGIYNSLNATSILMNVTIASNLCIAGGYGLPPTNGFSAGDQIVNSNGTVYLCNSLLAYAGTNGNAYGTVTDNGYNISSDASANLSSGSSYNYTDPKLGPLADNGGPTLTMALLSSSPAIDLGTSQNAPNTDQREYLRPIGGGVDEGAFEYNSYQVPMLYLAQGQSGITLNFSANAPKTYYIQCSTNLVNWSNVETNGPFTSFTNLSRTYNTQNGAHCYYRLLLQ